VSDSSESDARYPTKVEFVGEVILLGPNGQEFNAQGLYKENFYSPYDENRGPFLVGAKLNYCDPNVADGASNNLLNQQQPPNHEYALYGDILAEAEANGKVSCRLRVLTTGGFSPDGIRPLLPTDYESFFRVHATGADGSTVWLEEENVDYDVQGGKLRVIGLSDLGGKEGENGIVYDDCYAEDGDNYIDIILVGDDAAMRNVTHIEIGEKRRIHLPYNSVKSSWCRSVRLADSGKKFDMRLVGPVSPFIRGTSPHATITGPL